jgi:hypothetical protein
MRGCFEDEKHMLARIYDMLELKDALMVWGRTLKGGVRQTVMYGCDTVIYIGNIGYCDVCVSNNADRPWMIDVEIEGPGEFSLIFTMNDARWRAAFENVMAGLNHKP